MFALKRFPVIQTLGKNFFNFNMYNHLLQRYFNLVQLSIAPQISKP